MGCQSRVSSSAGAETMQHAVYHGDPDPDFRGLGQAFIVFAESARLAEHRSEPRACAFQDPAPGRDLKALRVGVAAYDVQSPVRHLL